MKLFSTIKKTLLHSIVAAAAGIVFSTCAYAESGITEFAVEYEVPRAGITYRTEWWQQNDINNENEYFVSLPYDVEGKPVKIYFRSTGEVVFDGEKMENGHILESVEEGVHSVECDGNLYSLRILYLSNIPTIYIETQSGTLDKVYADKNYKEPGYMTIVDGDRIEFTGELEYIKGRGNNTWTLAKRPFNIKTVKKADLFDMGASKKWNLLANFNDDTGYRNKIACDLADAVGIKYSSKSEIVDIYANGEYLGNYTLIEKVEIAENRIEITDLEKITEDLNPNINLADCELGGTRGTNSIYNFGSYKWVEIPHIPRDVSGGYLIEYEIGSRYDEEVSGFITDFGQPVIVKSPEYASREQVEYIREYYQDMEDAILDDDGINDKGKHYSDYLDVESMVKMYVFQEYIKNLDSGVTSFYYYKDVNGKLTAGPVWDFDHALGKEAERYDINLADPYGYWVTNLRMFDAHNIDKPGIVASLCNHLEFRHMAAEQWKEFFKPEIENLLEEIKYIEYTAKKSFISDKCRWTKEGKRTYDEVVAEHDEAVYKLYNFADQRSKFMDITFSTDVHYVKYHANGGEGMMKDYGTYIDGDILFVRGPEFTNGDKPFYGWNTNPYGYGEEYVPGQTYPVTDDIVLYAQWEPGSIKNRIKAFIFEIFN